MPPTLKVKIYTSDNVAMVGSLRNYLEQHEINAEIRNEFSAGVMAELGFANAWPELWVLAEDAEAAKQLLKKVDPNKETNSGPDWLCKYCRESNPFNFEVCWQCNAQNA